MNLEMRAEARLGADVESSPQQGRADEELPVHLNYLRWRDSTCPVRRLYKSHCRSEDSVRKASCCIEHTSDVNASRPMASVIKIALIGFSEGLDAGEIISREM